MQGPKRHIPKNMGDLIVGEVVIFVIFILLLLSSPIRPLDTSFDPPRYQSIAKSVPHDF